MKVKEINKIIASSFNDFKCCNAIIYKASLKDILVGFYVEKTNLNNHYLWRFALPLYVPSEYVYFTFGQRILNKKGQEIFDFQTAESTRVSIQEIIEIIKSEKESLFKLEDYDSFIAGYKDKKYIDNIHVQQALAYTMCFLDWKEAKLMLENMVSNHSKDNISWVETILKRATDLINEINTGNHLSKLEEYKKFTLEKIGIKD